MADPSTAYTERDAALLFRQVIHGISHVHSCGYVHRDLKPENIFLKAARSASHDRSLDRSMDGLASSDPGGLEVVVGDLGLAAAPTAPVAGGTAEGPGNNEKGGYFEGTLPYAAPEQLTPPRFAFGFKSDVWAAGCILYILLAGRPPFYAKGGGTRQEQETRLVEEICSGGAYFGRDLFSGVTTEGVDLLRRMLTTDPRSRPSVRDVLKDPWFEVTVPDVLEAEHEARMLAEEQARARGGSDGDDEDADMDMDVGGMIAAAASTRSATSRTSAGSATSVLSGVQSRLRQFNARRRFRGAMMAALVMGGASVSHMTRRPSAVGRARESESGAWGKGEKDDRDATNRLGSIYGSRVSSTVMTAPLVAAGGRQGLPELWACERVLAVRRLLR